MQEANFDVRSKVLMVVTKMGEMADHTRSVTQIRGQFEEALAYVVEGEGGKVAEVVEARIAALAGSYQLVRTADVQRLINGARQMENLVCPEIGDLVAKAEERAERIRSIRPAF